MRTLTSLCRCSPGLCPGSPQPTIDPSAGFEHAEPEAPSPGLVRDRIRDCLRGRAARLGSYARRRAEPSFSGSPRHADRVELVDAGRAAGAGLAGFALRAAALGL